LVARNVQSGRFKQAMAVIYAPSGLMATGASLGE
jgi:hypothetical protein